MCTVNVRRGDSDNHSIPTNDAWDHVAKLLLPDEPVRKPTKRDAWLINRYRLSIAPHYLDRYGPPKNFAPNALIAEVDQAYFRLSLLERVNQWFEDKGFDIQQSTFPKHQFEAAVQADFGQLPPEPVKPIEKGAAKPKPRKAKPRKPKRPGMYKRFTKDDDLVVEGVSGIRSGTWSNPSQAAEALADRAKGTSHKSTVDRLRKKIGAALED